MMFWDPDGLQNKIYQYINIDNGSRGWIYISDKEYQNAIEGKGFTYSSATYEYPGILSPGFSRDHERISGKSQEEVDLYLSRELGRVVFGGRFRRFLPIPAHVGIIHEGYSPDFIEDLGWRIVASGRMVPWTQLASEHLELYLSGTAPAETLSDGRTRRAKYFSPSWVLNEKKATNAYHKNMKTIIENAYGLYKFNSTFKEDHYKTNPTSSPILMQDREPFNEFFWAAGSSNLDTWVSFKASKEKPNAPIVLEGYVYNKWHDVYDWAPELNKDGSPYFKSVVLPFLKSTFTPKNINLEISDAAWHSLESHPSSNAAPFAQCR
ncbi:hypothetical protein [Acanthopleuribacter pedis]|uniref:Uncharacterized protein n=1 Tax=Acanthopleuribacter pedis TaxID=442870 RepID=A0A8J7QLS0_9BACT|nr:hypothetical protein [Acanthopleuribacter pedis]MBO1323531.1 hypothetical protein [Acanthopleuribacter pedis]